METWKARKAWKKVFQVLKVEDGQLQLMFVSRKTNSYMQM